MGNLQASSSRHNKDHDLSLERFILSVEARRRQNRRRIGRSCGSINQSMLDSRTRLYWIFALAELATKSNSSRKLAELLEVEFPSLRKNSRKVANRLLREAKLLAEEALLSMLTNDADDEPRTTGSPPASPRVIDNLPTSISRSSCCGEICNICHEHYVKDTLVKHLPCGHFFHSTCIDTWLNRSCTCPLCRQELPTTVDDNHTSYK